MTSGVPLRLLMVEDSDDDAFFIIRQLRKGGYEPEYLRVDTLPAVTDALSRGGWDLLISDYNLPCCNGLDVLRVVRERNLDIPVIIVSGAIGEDLAVETMHAGAHDYIMKDRLARLLPAVQRELSEAGVRRERRLALEALRESEERFRELTETIQELFWMIDARRGRMIYVSPAYEKVFQRSASPLYEGLAAFLEAVHPEDVDRVQTLLRREGWAYFNLEYRIQRPDGSERWVTTRSFPVIEEGEVRRIAGLTTDATERKRLEVETQKLCRALEQSADAVMILNRDGNVEYVNAAFEDISGYGRSEVMRRPPNFLRSGHQDEDFYERLWRTLRSGLPFTDLFVSRRKDGELYYEEKTISPVRGTSGEITHYVSTGRDVTRRLRAQQQAQRAARRDPATHLGTGLLFVERLAQALLQARRLNQGVGVLCTSVDFAELLGETKPAAEQKLLPLVAERLRHLARPEDLVARLDNGQFAILRREVGSPRELEDLANAIAAAFSHPVSNDGYQLFLTPVIGISLFPGDGEEAEELLAKAMRAMQVSREKSMSYSFFTPAQPDIQNRYQ